MKTRINHAAQFRAGWKAARREVRRLAWAMRFHALAFLLGYELRHGLPVIP